jgi:ppGpp synthetase/RelA/SpoT-type nucleotidyltranferase/CheY-like chemotaxis protein
MKQAKNTILLIDDDYKGFIEDLSLPSKAFQLCLTGFETIEKGIEEFQNIQDKVGAILLDLSFTAGNYEGVEGLEKIRSINHLVPVIILTGSQSANDLKMAVNCMKNGAFNYVLKTNLDDPASLFEMLKAAIRQYESNADNERHTKLKEEFISKFSAYGKMLHTTEMIVSDMLKGQMMFPPTIEKRIKEFKSFYNKLLSKEEKEGTITDPFKRLTDVAGMRVIFYNTVDLEKAVSMLLSSDDFLAIDGNTRLKPDNKTNTFGYRAFHFDVKVNPAKRLHLKEYEGIEEIPCEIQFKTIFAHSWSKVHHAFSYKQNGTVALDSDTQGMLNEDFNKAAKNLEDIENQITILCRKYAEATKILPNAT